MPDTAQIERTCGFREFSVPDDPDIRIGFGSTASHHYRRIRNVVTNAVSYSRVARGSVPPTYDPRRPETRLREEHWQSLHDGVARIAPAPVLHTE